MLKFIRLFVIVATFGLSGTALADTVSVTHGGDTFVSGDHVNKVVESVGDAFPAARTIDARVPAGGAYGVAMRIWSGFGGAEDPSNIARLMVFGAAILFVALLNFIPFVGWVANYTLVLLGAGAMTRALFQWLIGNSKVAFDVDMKPIED